MTIVFILRSYNQGDITSYDYNIMTVDSHESFLWDLLFVTCNPFQVNMFACN